MGQEARERLTRVVAATSVAFSLAYIVWRWGWTLNTDALWFSVPLAIAETYGLLTAFFLTFTGWRLKTRKSPPPLRDRTVDVFVTTYDEPLAIIRKTALAARGLTYPHETWVLDDGRRDDVEAMAREIGVRYLRRDSNEHAKAGNLNNALAHSRGEFILQLDADHVPLPHMIDRLIGFFAEPSLAFVQSPQDFYNTDAFTYEVDAGTRRLWEDQQLFFRVLQPGKDRVNAAFFVGSCALLRREAVESIGGFATKTITEDIETSMLLHSRGWTSAYYGESLAYGLAPANATAFHVQHLRWGQGAMQALRQYGPLRMKGLTLAQRIAYLDSLTTYLGGFQRLILYCAPLVFFITGAFPLRVSAAEFAAVFIPYIALQWASFKLLARGNGSLLLADRFAMAKFFTHIRSVTGYITTRRLRFRVTPKGALASIPPGTFVPQLTLVVATVGALALAVYERQSSYADEVPGWGSAAVWVNVLFAAWNAWVASSIVRVAFAGRQQRSGFRFAESLPVGLQIFRKDGKLAALDVAVTGDLSPAGTALRSLHAIPDDARVALTLPLSRASVPVRGRLVNRREQVTPYGTVHIHGIEFEELSVDARDAIELHCAQHATPLERQRYDQNAKTRFRNIRGETRVSVGMPAEVFVGPGTGRSLGLALLEDVSPVGARIVIDHPVQPATMIRLSIPGTTLDASGKVVFVHALETSLGMRFVVGIDTTGVGDGAAATGSSAGLAWFSDVLRLATRYGATARTLAIASGRRVYTSSRRLLAALPAMLTRPSRPTAVSNDTTTAVPEAVAAPVADEVSIELPALAAADAAPLSGALLAPAELSAAAAEVEELVPQAVAQEIEEAELVLDEADIPMDADFSVGEPAQVAVAYTQPGEEPMPSSQQSLVRVPQGADAPSPVLFTVRGKSAKIDGAFGEADSIEVLGQITGDLRIAGELIIAESASVNGNVTAQRVRVEGEFSGDLRATDDIEIGASGTVNGTLKCDELVIERGGIFNGTATRTARNRQQQQQHQAASNRDRAASRNEQPAKANSQLADVAAPPPASVLDFSPDDDNFDYQARQIPLA
jgi:cellulose synthase (UDP-forming)